VVYFFPEIVFSGSSIYFPQRVPEFVAQENNVVGI
jgi:hypothetical protein